MIFSAMDRNVRVVIKPANINNPNENNNTTWLLNLKSQIVKIIRPKISQYSNEEIAAVCSLIMNTPTRPINQTIKIRINLFLIFWL